MFKINGIEYSSERRNDKTIDHSLYLHKVMRELKEYKDRPREGYYSTYYILESKEPKEFYLNKGLSSMTDDDWLIIKDTTDFFVVGKYVSWLERTDHEPEYEMLDAQGFVDSYLNNK